MINNLQIYSLLKEKFNENMVLGTITFNTLEGNIIIKEKDIIGNSIQSWLFTFLNTHKVNFTLPISTQSFPDFIINPNTQEEQFLEVKSWYGPASPAFDLANFDSYISTLSDNVLKLDADYLIFKYDLINGEIVIMDVFLKKIWEITCPSNTYPLKVQQKRNIIYNIRPATWYSTKTKFKPFLDRKSFVKALSETNISYKGDSNNDVLTWYDSISEKYFEKTNTIL